MNFLFPLKLPCQETHKACLKLLENPLAHLQESRTYYHSLEGYQCNLTHYSLWTESLCGQEALGFIHWTEKGLTAAQIEEGQSVS